ncbi:DUF58 domain-containing protein [Hydrogenophaga sp. SNF1]|uniref:DUF58 domain-containing protein n=1 Tax=Hydrogenophaga sp. SNF1 TaxID=3098762 RepID=UPI002ACBE488|nr:DUF58 domain-containing protein [Hydrogenophaga sp. SNF1]WQB85074.1 DUF58 domain-containing protein [Hydrogenophaga sp. SNF1]
MSPPRSAFGASPQGAAPAARQSRFRGALDASPSRFNFKARARAWFHNRLKRSDTLTLTQRNVYILPTRAGWMLALTLLLLLVASINYQLNLGYLLTFLLAGSALVGMHVSHNNLRGLTLHLHPPEPVHAHQAVVLEVRLSSGRRRARHGIGLGVVPDDGGAPALAWADVPAQGSAELQLAWQAPARGLHALPALSAMTLFPLGTFRVWTVWRPAAQALVYPTPEEHPPPLPPGEPLSGGAGSARVQATGEYDGVRAYRRGDPMKAVVWKKAAQAFAGGRDELVSRDALSSQRQQLWLDLNQCGGTGPEGRVSRLTAWVLMADRLELDYGLRLPGREIAPDQGPVHRSQCLEALALC